MVDPYEFFVTPEWITETLMRLVPFKGRITESCCGSGAISRVLLRHGHEVESFDLVDRGYGYCSSAKETEHGRHARRCL
jgi:hypothetical protein